MAYGRHRNWTWRDSLRDKAHGPDNAAFESCSLRLRGASDVAAYRGVVPDIRHESLRQRPKPMVYLPSQETSILTVRTGGDLRDLERAAETLQQQYFPDDVVSARRIRNYFAANYADDLRLARLPGLASLIALAIAAFGIYVLSDLQGATPDHADRVA